MSSFRTVQYVFVDELRTDVEIGRCLLVGESKNLRGHNGMLRHKLQLAPNNNNKCISFTLQ